MFREYGIFKDGYRGSGNTQGNIIVDVPMPDRSDHERYSRVTQIPFTVQMDFNQSHIPKTPNVDTLFNR